MVNEYSEQHSVKHHHNLMILNFKFQHLLNKNDSQICNCEFGIVLTEFLKKVEKMKILLFVNQKNLWVD